MSLLIDKLLRVSSARIDALAGRLLPLQPTLDALAARPFELHFELTNLCNANCVFCPYQYQQRAIETMSDQVFHKALSDFVAAGGGSVLFTPIVGDALIDKQFLERVHLARNQSAVDRINVTTNAILVHRFGARELIDSGLSQITISIAGFDEAMYRRVYRSAKYKTVLRNVLALLEQNERAGRPVSMVVGLRPDRPLEHVMEQPDLQRVLAYDPILDFTWSYTNAGGRISRDELPAQMRMRRVRRKPEACVQVYNGPIVLPDGSVLACSCVAAMDAVDDLAIGNVLNQDLSEIWCSQAMGRLRESFGTQSLNPTCSACDMYRNLDLYRSREGRRRAELSRRRGTGERVQRKKPRRPFAGG